MTCLTIVQDAFTGIGLPSPTTAIGNTDENVIRMLALSNRIGRSLADDYGWQNLTTESTFSAVAAESQGDITTLAGTDFGWLREETVFNRTQKRRWYPIDDVQWQAMKADGITGPDYYFRIRGNLLIVQPTPTAGETVVFEWVSKNWCESSGGAGQSAWAADSDVALIDAELITLGTIWRWKQVNGFDYAEDFREFSRRLANATARDGAKKRIRLGGGALTQFMSNRNVAQGSWSL